MHVIIGHNLTIMPKIGSSKYILHADNDNFWTTLKVQKSGMDPRKGLGTERRLGGQLGVQTGWKWVTWASRRESCL